MNTCDGMKNLRIVREVAAVTRGQDMPFFEVGEGMFDKNSAKFGHENLCLLYRC